MTSAETTTPLEYETAAARFHAISSNHERLAKLLEGFGLALEDEYNEAAIRLHEHERVPGIHKRFTGYALTIDAMNLLEVEARARLDELFPWSAEVHASGMVAVAVLEALASAWEDQAVAEVRLVERSNVLAGCADQLREAICHGGAG